MHDGLVVEGKPQNVDASAEAEPVADTLMILVDGLNVAIVPGETVGSIADGLEGALEPGVTQHSAGDGKPHDVRVG
ncbi:hypothetical protein [Belnapia rosea]|uniref:hypothetical protein n=1 Tax=Belnapia rosea TaxID=938405 RepID=UPI00115FBA70|nr:hypothetical protein [Belnapia rosea]